MRHPYRTAALIADFLGITGSNWLSMDGSWPFSAFYWPVIRDQCLRCMSWTLPQQSNLLLLLPFLRPCLRQVYFGLVITFSVVLITTRCMPYKNDATDRYKVVMDVNLFFTFSCTLMLKLNLAGEILQPAFFDCKPRQRLYCCGLEKRHTNTLIFCVTDAMVTSNLIIGGIPVVWSVINSAKSIYENTLQVKLIIRM